MIRDLIGGKPNIHSRDIRLATYPYQKDEVIVEGFLLDRRTHPVFDITGEVKPAGIIHHMAIRLIVKGNPLVIKEAEAEMIDVPLDGCWQTLDTMDAVRGLHVRSGFSNRIRSIMGGPKGCTHLCHLLTLMGQEIVHGWLTHTGSTLVPVPETMDDIREKEYLLNSCRMWTPDGPKIKAIRQAIKNRPANLKRNPI
jgi:hypothetical protein